MAWLDWLGLLNSHLFCTSMLLDRARRTYVAARATGAFCQRSLTCRCLWLLSRSRGPRTLRPRTTTADASLYAGRRCRSSILAKPIIVPPFSGEVPAQNGYPGLRPHSGELATTHFAAGAVPASWPR